jgi:hemolysin activation/secretion protein
LHLRLGGQAATGPVPSGEQFTIGGAESVRGYYEAEGAGDQAVLGSIEWRSADVAVRLSRWLSRDTGEASATDKAAVDKAADQPPPWFTQSYALAFVDVGRTYVFEPGVGQAARTSLAGAGFGFRVKLRKAVTGELDVAWPLRATAATSVNTARAHFKLAVDF